MLRVLRAVLKMAVDEGVIVRDPSEALQPHERPKQRSKRKGRRLSPQQLEEAIATAEERVPGFAPLIVLLAWTGVRIREALACAGRTSTSTPRPSGSAGSWPPTTAATSGSRPRRASATFRSCPHCGGG
jgi:hypothetical protein